MSACISKVWGDYANPNGYTNSKKIHAYFEGEFVKRNLSRAVVAAAVGPYRICNCTIEEEMLALLLNSLSRVEPLYQLEKEGAFKPGDSRGIAFAVERLSAGAQALRDMIVDAWFDSEETPVGYPMVNVRDIESGKVRGDAGAVWGGLSMAASRWGRAAARFYSGRPAFTRCSPNSRRLVGS